MKVKSLPMPDIVQINKMILVETEDKDSTDDVPRTYALDSQGRIWTLETEMSTVFQGLELDVPKKVRKG